MSENYPGPTYTPGEFVLVDGTNRAVVEFNTNSSHNKDYRVVVRYPWSEEPDPLHTVERDRVTRIAAAGPAFVNPEPEPLYQFSLTATPQLRRWSGSHHYWDNARTPQPVNISVFAPDRESAEAKAATLLPPLRTDARWRIEVAGVEEVG